MTVIGARKGHTETHLPEPWERVRDAVNEQCGGNLTDSQCRRVAELLTRAEAPGCFGNEVAEARDAADAFRERAITAEQERDRLRREVEALRDEARRGIGCKVDVSLSSAVEVVADRLDAILAGGES